MFESYRQIFAAFDDPPHLVGGVIRHQYDGMGYKDIDWLCYSKDQFDRTCNYITQRGFSELTEYRRSHYRFYLPIGCTLQDTAPQQIFHNDRITSPSLFLTEHCDFSICKILFDGSVFHTHPKFKDDILTKTLRVVNGDFRDIHPRRIDKFQRRGYRLTTMS